MKTTTKIFGLLMLIMAIGAGMEVEAQGKGRSKHGHGNNHDRKHHDREHDRNRGKNQHYHHNHRVVYHCDHPAHVRTATVYQYRAPRYVYFRDHNVYYDNHRNVYIVYAAGNWVVSRTIPVAIRRIHIERARRIDVDYYDDDFTRFLERTRPRGSVYVAW